METSSHQIGIPDWETTEKINQFLKNVNSLDFSSTGIENIANSYNVSIDQVNQLIYRARRSRRKA
ncbi:hypothetical protein BDD43_3514 [Mucilaginibacter gracilis]|uniref:Uncharacterized protein n=1 Tax=Mucilaginibacter gracilis TaxID=423350 RepID=A0A495J5P7_9SPHI|nr:hypothetical protein [Mucilaginibacter gracilis]RKR83309.1 hypothetical protein BDD43_3514 [Mucilaginibacter gracilis]